MLEAAMIWNEPNNKSHWDFENDPGWQTFARMTRLAGEAIAAEAPGLPRVLGGIVVVESVFGWPGIGQLAWQAIQRVDIPIIMGVTLVSAFAIVLGNLLADLVTPFIDPRIRLR